MAFENTAGRGVNVFYGNRSRLEGLSGVMKTQGAIKQLVVELTTENINAGFIGFESLPAGVKPLRVLVDVEALGALAGTTPAVEIGTKGSEATNGFSIAEAVVEAVGITEITSFNGTFAAELAAKTTLGVALSGAGVALTGGLIMKIILEYAQIK